MERLNPSYVRVASMIPLIEELSTYYSNLKPLEQDTRGRDYFFASACLVKMEYLPEFSSHRKVISSMQERLKSAKDKSERRFAA
jgi:hypothetical protein